MSTSALRSNTLARRVKDRKKGTLYPKGSDGLCSIGDCREIAEWHVFEQPHPIGEINLCKEHFEAQATGVGRAKRLPHIVTKEDGKLYVKCLFCLREWRPLSFDLPKEDKDYGRLPNKCSHENCRATILTLIGKNPRFGRGSRQAGFKKGGGVK